MKIVVAHCTDEQGAVRTLHTGNDRSHQAGAEIHFAKDTIAITGRVSAARLKSVALHGINRIRLGVDYENASSSRRAQSL
jgi:hypothetical protein